MMQNEIDRLRALIEENGFGVKDSKSENKIKAQSTNLGLGNTPSAYEEEHGDVLSMRSVKSSNAVFHSKTPKLAINPVDDQQRSSNFNNAGERYDDTARVERQSKNVISLVSARRC